MESRSPLARPTEKLPVQAPSAPDRALAEIDGLTRLMRAYRAGDDGAGNELVARLYPWMRAMARRQLRRFPGELSVGATELLHEAFLRLADRDHDAWRSRSDFVALAVTVVRRVLVDQARRRGRLKRGGPEAPIPLSAVERALGFEGPPVDFLDLDRALERLGRIDASALRLLELRFFGGMSLEEAADQLRIGRSTAVRSWRWARAWLHDELSATVAGRRRP